MCEGSVPTPIHCVSTLCKRLSVCGVCSVWTHVSRVFANTLHRTVAHCNTHCNTLQHALQHTTCHLQHTTCQLVTGLVMMALCTHVSRLFANTLHHSLFTLVLQCVGKTPYLYRHVSHTHQICYSQMICCSTHNRRDPYRSVMC